MRLFRTFIVDQVVFPFQDTIGEGVLRAVERSGYMLITGCVIEGVDAGDLVIPAPDWIRRAVTGG